MNKILIVAKTVREDLDYIDEMDQHLSFINDRIRFKDKIDDFSHCIRIDKGVLVIREKEILLKESNINLLKHRYLKTYFFIMPNVVKKAKKVLRKNNIIVYHQPMDYSYIRYIRRSKLYDLGNMSYLKMNKAKGRYKYYLLD